MKKTKFRDARILHAKRKTSAGPMKTKKYVKKYKIKSLLKEY